MAFIRKKDRHEKRVQLRSKVFFDEILSQRATRGKNAAIVNACKVRKNWVETGEHDREIIDAPFIRLNESPSTRLQSQPRVTFSVNFESPMYPSGLS